MSQPNDNEGTTAAPTGEAPTGETSTGLSADRYSTASYPDYSGPPQAQGYPAVDNQTIDYGGQGASAVASGAPSAGYPAPGYTAPPGYPTPGYGAAAGYGTPPGYAAPPGYGSPYGYPSYAGVSRGPVRPGGATASAVLMFIQAAVTLISTFYVLFFASLASGVDSSGLRQNSLETEWTIIGILQLVSVGLLIFAAVQLLGGSRNGRTLSIVACGVQLALVIYWMVRISSLPDFDVDGTTFFFVVPLMYAVLPLVALPLALAKPVGDYVAAKAPSPSTTA